MRPGICRQMIGLVPKVSNYDYRPTDPGFAFTLLKYYRLTFEFNTKVSLKVRNIKIRDCKRFE